MKLKKFLAVVLASVMLLCSVPLAELAGFVAENLPKISFELFAKAQETEISEETVTASGTCGENLTWVLYENGTLVISGTGEMVMEDDYGHTPWYKYRASIKSVTIEYGVTNICSDAFIFCGSLVSITIPDSVTSIGSEAFMYCDNLVSITIPDSVTSIGYNAFYSCDSIERITIPDSVTSIGDSAFGWCDKLKSITVDKKNDYYSNDSYGVLFNKDKTELIQYPLGNIITSYSIPASVIRMKEYAFAYCTNLERIIVPNSVSVIDNRVFAHCYSLISIELPEGLTSIGESAFYCCSNLISVKFPNSLKTIKEEAFSECESLISIDLPDNLTIIEKKAFYNCTGLALINLPDNLTIIGESIFEKCSSLISIIIPDSVRSIGYRAFSGCTSLTSIDMPARLTSIGDCAFGSCSSLTSINISKGITRIGGSLFSGCSSLTSVEIPDGVTHIYDFAFSGCTSLISITLPTTLTNVWNSVFMYCSKLSDIYYSGSEEEWNAVSIDISNRCFDYVTMHFNSIAPDNSEDFSETLQYGADRFSFGENIEGHIGEIVNSLALYESETNDTTALTFTSTNTDVVEIGEIQYATGEFVTLENQHIATVPLIFKSEGTSVVTVTSPDGLNSSITVSVKPVEYELKLYSTVSTLLVGKGRSIGAAVELEINGVPIGEKCEYSFAVSNSDIVSISDVKISNSDNNTYFTINGLEEGTAKLTITELSTGATYSATVTVNKGILTYNAEALPKYYDGKHECNGIISGMYIDEFVCSQTDNSNMSVSFNVYNTTGLVGVVAVYDADGNLKESLPIKRFDGGIISSVYDTLKECYYLVKDIATGDILSYKQSSYSEKTEFKDIKVPKGGRIEITNDIMYSDACCLLNVSELAINTILLLGDTIKGLSSEEIKKVAEESSVTLLKNKMLEKIPGMAEEFREKVLKSIMSDIGTLAISDALNIITDNVTKIFNEFGVDFTKLVVDSAASVTVGIAEDAFVAATSFVGVALKGMFIAADYIELSAFIMNFAIPRSESVMKIYFDDENGCLSDDGVTIKAENGTVDLSEANFVMHSVVISDGDLMPDVIKEALDNVSDEYVLRDIYLERDGVISQPNQPVLVSIPVPEGYIDVTLYWVNDDGTLVEIPYTVAGGKYITFITNHFSYYAIVNGKHEEEICKEHVDNDGDFLCDNGCGFEFEKNIEPNIPNEPVNTCDHMCHSTGFTGFIWKIVQFFWKLFKMNPVCECGAAHY